LRGKSGGGAGGAPAGIAGEEEAAAAMATREASRPCSRQRESFGSITELSSFP